MKIKSRSNSAQLRDKILEAATKILGESGLKKLAQPQIAKEANIRQSHLTYYFPKRSDLILAVTERTLELIREQIPKGSQALGRGVYVIVGRLLKDKSRTRALIGLLVESDENPDLRKRLQELSRQHEQLLATISGRPLGDTYVQLAHAALHGIALQNYLHGEERSRHTDAALKALAQWMDVAPFEKSKKKRKSRHDSP